MQKQYSAREPYIRRLDLWAPDDTYTNHRIPGMLVTDRGTLLVYCEARRSAGDWAMMDILMQRSEDCGETFGQKIILAAGSEEHNTVNNPVMLQERSGRIHFLYCEDYTIRGGRILRRYSDDDGLTWSEPIDITHFAMPEFHNAFALGPGHGIVTPDGTLLVPIWMVPRRYEEPLTRHSPSVVSTFFSRDGGETWSLGEILDTNPDVICPNESVAAVISAGEIYLNIRHQASHRAQAYSADGCSGWREYSPNRSLWDPRCFGSVAAYDDGVNPYSLIFVNCASKTGRKNITVRVSVDDGQSYPYARTVDAERGGYAEIAVDSRNGLIYLLYEDQYGITDHLVMCNYAWLTAEPDKMDE